jgi:hypothetical protein
MQKVTRSLAALAVVLMSVAGVTGTASAVNIDWLQMAPTAFNSMVPNSSVFFVPGIGNVTMTYSVPPAFSGPNRFQNPCLVSGSLGTYSWSNNEELATTLLTGPDPIVPVVWSVTYTFPSLLAPGTVFVGISGLGQTSSFGGGATIATVNQNGTFLGDWSGTCGPYGPTQFTGGVGTFSMQNSLTGVGGYDPWWNTPLGVVEIGDFVNSITIYASQIRGDGIGVNIGFDASGVTPAATPTWGHLKTMYR